MLWQTLPLLRAMPPQPTTGGPTLGVLIAAVNSELPSARLLSCLTKGGVMLMAAAIALEQVGIGRMTVLIAFTILFGGVTLAAAIAVGLGAQDTVRQWMASRAAPRAAGEPETIRHW